MPSNSTERRARHALPFALAALALGFGGALLLLEIASRLLPVATGLFAQPVNAANPVFRFQPNRPYVWSVGWNFAIVNHGRSNGAGFVNDQEYERDAAGPLLAVVGDSYVEALMVPYEHTMHGRLARELAPRARVYSFAASGAPLSQYLVWMAHARERFSADALAVVVVGNDFDESLARYKVGPGFHHFVERSDGAFALERFDYAPGSLRRVVRHSALARYLVFNLHAEAALRRLVDRFVAPAQADALPKFIGNTTADADEQRLVLSRRAIDAFLERVGQMTGLSPEQIVFLVDGLRPQLYAGEAAERAVAQSYFARMRDYFVERASAHGYEVVDLGPLFKEHYAEHGRRFEFETDFHWNALGHAVAASALADTRLLRRLLEGVPAAQ